MSQLHFNLNRPIHLARRDAFFERAAELLNMPVQELDTRGRMDHVDRVLSLLQTAEQHAFFASRSPDATGQENDFLHFLKLISHNVQSAHSMIQHQSHLEGEEGFLCQFLNATPAECALPALHYRRRADDILQGLWQLLRLAHKPYRELQQTNITGMDEKERDRYRNAYRLYREETTDRARAESARAGSVVGDR